MLQSIPGHTAKLPLTLAVTLGAVVLGAVVLGTLAESAEAQRRGRGGWRDRADLEHLIYKEDQTIPSKALRGKARYCIYLPKDYDEESAKQTRYPVVYHLHGMNEDHKRFRFRGGAKALDRLVGAKKVPPLIFVCVFDGSRRSFYVNGERRRVEDMLLEELIPHIDKTFRTKAERAHRALLGVSMGGYGALKIAFKNPKSFAVVATHSAAILPEKYGDLGKVFPWTKSPRARGLANAIFGSPVDEKLWAAENPMTLARKLDREKLHGLKIYFDCGSRDRYDFDGPNADLHALLVKRKIPHAWKLVKGGQHGSEYNSNALPNSMAFIAAAWKQQAGIKSLSGALGGSIGGKTKKDSGKPRVKKPK